MEKDLLVRQQEQLIGIQKLIRSGNIDLDDIADLIPGVVHLNEMHTLNLTYIDRRSRAILEVNREEIEYNGGRILNTFVKPESLLQAKSLFGGMTFNDKSKVVSHFQGMKYLAETKHYEWFYSVKKKFDDNNIITISNPVSTLGDMQKQVRKILEDNQYIRHNLHKLHLLSEREKEIIKLIFEGYKTNAIAEMLFISPHTVQTHRKNIKRKLEIKNYKELFKFAVEFDLI